jgi:hypothetical protein
MLVRRERLRKKLCLTVWRYRARADLADKIHSSENTKGADSQPGGIVSSIFVRITPPEILNTKA